jgi:nitrogen regulatory protein P-II 2
MALTRHPRQLLVIIAEAALEKPLASDVKRLGAHGYTVYDVRGAGSMGVREGDWEADRTIEMKVICEGGVADRIAEHVLATYGANFAVTLFFADVQVLRPQKF